MTTYDLYHNDQMTNFICFELNVERALTLLMVPIFVWMFVRKIWFRVFITLHWTLFKMKNVTSKRKNNSGCKSGYRETFCEKKMLFSKCLDSMTKIKICQNNTNKSQKSTTR